MYSRNSIKTISSKYPAVMFGRGFTCSFCFLLLYFRQWRNMLGKKVRYLFYFKFVQCNIQECFMFIMWQNSRMLRTNGFCACIIYVCLICKIFLKSNTLIEIINVFNFPFWALVESIRYVNLSILVSTISERREAARVSVVDMVLYRNFPRDGGKERRGKRVGSNIYREVWFKNLCF